MITLTECKQMADDHDSCLAVRISELEKQLALHVKYQQEAVIKAHADLGARLDGMNEFRAALKDQAAQFITREELNSRHAILRDQIQSHQNVIVNWQGRIWALSVAVMMVSGLVSGGIAWFATR